MPQFRVSSREQINLRFAYSLVGSYNMHVHVYISKCTATVYE